MNEFHPGAYVRRHKDGRLDVYFSFWSWKMLKVCPHQYKLTLYEKLRPAKMDKGNAIQGGVPDKMAEVFFAMPVAQRQELTLQWFYDQFEYYWNLWTKDAWVDWSKHNQGEKKKETLAHIQNLVQMLNEKHFVDMVCETQKEFKQKVYEDGELTLTVGGRIDCLFEVTSNVWDIWDLKGVKKVEYNDIDQLLIYKMGMTAMGRNIRTVGFLNMKQKQFDPKPAGEAELTALKSKMVDLFKKTVLKGVFMPIYQAWSCSYCDVRGACATFQEKERSSLQVADLLGTAKGKVTI